MPGYFSTRWLNIIPMTVLLSIILFFLTASQSINQIVKDTDDIRSYEKHILINGEREGKALPLFFFSIPPLSWADTLRRIPYSTVYDNIKALSIHFGNGKKAVDFRDKLLTLYHSLQESESPPLPYLQHLSLLLHRGKIKDIEADLAILRSLLDKDTEASTSPPLLTEINRQWYRAKGFHLSNFIPTIKWNGLSNQYYQWLHSHFSKKNIDSSVDAIPVLQKISAALKWTVFISISSLLIIFLVSIPMGLYMGYHPEQRITHFISRIFFAIYSIPDFWLATILIVLFTSKHYCEYCNIFPVPGMLYIEEQGFLHTVFSHLSYFALPFIVTCMDAIAYLGNQIRATTERESNKNYVLAARARGLSEGQILWRHIAPNALFPLLILLVDIIPGLVTGTLIIEVIFNIPGMGRLLYESVLSQDIYVIRDILILTGILTFIAYVLADQILSKLHPNAKLSRF